MENMGFKPTNFLELAMAMKTRAWITIDGDTGLVNGIQPEDGSGRCWIVTLMNHGKTVSKFFRE